MPFYSIREDEFAKTEILNIVNYGAKGNGISDDTSALQTAIIKGGDNTILIPAGTYIITENITIPADVMLWFSNGAKLDIASGKTITFKGKLQAGMYQIFTGSGFISFSPGSVDEVFPQWWGAKGDSTNGSDGTDNSTPFQSAIASAPLGGTIHIPAGNYRVTSPIVVNRRLNIIGDGYGSQIFQASTDQHLFDITVRLCSLRRFMIGSAATTEGKALINLDYAGASGGHAKIEDVWMYGGYYGVYIQGSIGNEFVNLSSYGNESRFFAYTNCSVNQIWVYGKASGGINPNINTFIDMKLSHGTKGFVWESGSFYIYNGSVQGGADVSQGVVLNNVQQHFTINGLHIEFSGGGGVNGYLVLTNCYNGRITSLRNTGDTKVQRCINIAFEGCYVSSVAIDKFSRGTRFIDTLYTTLVDDGSLSEISNLRYSDHPEKMEGGIQNKAGRNLIDGDLEVWANGLPTGFAPENSAVVTKTGVGEADTIKKFGNYSAKIVVGSGKTRGGIYYLFSGNTYKKMACPDPTNYRSPAYEWSLSSSGTNEYYLKLAGGGNPSVDVKPRSVFFDGAPRIEGTLGSLNAGQWGYGDNDSLGYNTLYVRLADDADPDTKASGFVEGIHKSYAVTISAWVYKPSTNGQNPNIYVIFKGGVVANWHSGQSWTIRTEEWTRVRRTVVLDARVTEMQVTFGIYGGSEGDTVYYDGLEIVEGVSATPTAFDSNNVVPDRLSAKTINGAVKALSFSSTINATMIDGCVFTLTTTGNCTINANSGIAGQRATFIIADNATGTHVVTFGDNFKSTGTLTGTANKSATIDFVYNGTYWCEVSRTTGL